MEVSTDPYELRLYHMFQSCKSEQSTGLLDEEALRRLCAQLELSDKGTKLISSLEANGNLKLGVSYEQFKAALLIFLGTENDDYVTETSTTLKERSLVISDDVEDAPAYIESPPESSDREVSPKLVVGTKKYGRRSRPQTAMDDFSVTESDNTDEEQQELHSLNDSNVDNTTNSVPVQRSASQTDIPGSRRYRPTQLSGNKLKRCSSLPARKNLQQTSKLNASKAKVNKTTVAITTQQTATTKKSNAQETERNSSSMESLGYHHHHRQHITTDQLQQSQPPEPVTATIYSAYVYEQQKKYSNSQGYSNFGTSFCKDTVTAPEQLEMLSAISIVDIWEQAHITNGRNMLIALGFDEEQINVPQLIKVLEDELRGLDDESHAHMLRALVALQSAELCTLRQAYRHLHAENCKTRADHKEANRRVTMLAIEIDERHASIEENSRKLVEDMEQRHITIARELTARMTNDRDNWTALTSRLEAQIKKLEQEEIKLKTDLDLKRNENAELESENIRTQKQLSELLEQNIKLNNELAKSVNDSDDKPADRSSQILEKTPEDDEMLLLIEKISSLQLENSQLRDKNDELVTEMENLQLELSRTKNTKSSQAAKKTQATTGDEATNADDAALEQNGAATATKRRGDSPSKARITEESPRLGKLRKCTDESGASEQSDTSGEWMPLNSELQKIGSEEAMDASTFKQKINELEKSLEELQKLTMEHSDDRCKELEANLFEMHRAYEECENYWQKKLSEERQLFEEERQSYEDEQHENNKKFTELMEKVREYEEQYNKDGRLSPIQERDLLEQQYNELEAEANEFRVSAMLMLEEKSNKIESLQSEIEDLRVRLGESVEILTGASELNTEAVVQQLNTAGDALSPASSPISYLWHQSTIQEPAKSFATATTSYAADDEAARAIDDGAAGEGAIQALVAMNSPSERAANRNNLTTSETTIFSTTPIDSTASSNTPPQPLQDQQQQPTQTTSESQAVMAPIQKPTRAKSPQQQSEGEIADCETSSTASNKSSDTQLMTKTDRSRANNLKEELKRLKCFEITLKDKIKDLSLQRDGLVMELQQLQEARPVLEKAYARTAHPSLLQRVNQLELKNRHLQNVIKQQQQYTETMINQTWHKHQITVNEARGHVESQAIMLAEQSQRLQKADVLVKELYVENAHLTATVQRLEQQRARVNLLHQQQHLQQQQQQQQRLIGGLPGMP